MNTRKTVDSGGGRGVDLKWYDTMPDYLVKLRRSSYFEFDQIMRFLYSARWLFNEDWFGVPGSGFFYSSLENVDIGRQALEIAPSPIVGLVTDLTTFFELLAHPKVPQVIRYYPSIRKVSGHQSS